MEITYTTSAQDVTVSQLQGGFFEGWPTPPAPEAHLRILQNSYRVVLAIDEANNTAVGFITAISDGLSAAYIPHLEVLRPYRGRGIGSQLVTRMLEQLQHLYMIDLVCDEEVQPFYRRLDFRPASAMIRRNYARQACD